MMAAIEPAPAEAAAEAEALFSGAAPLPPAAADQARTVHTMRVMDAACCYDWDMNI